MSKPLIDGRRWERARDGIEEEAAELARILRELKEDGADPAQIASGGLSLINLLGHLSEIDKIADEWKSGD